MIAGRIDRIMSATGATAALLALGLTMASPSAGAATVANASQAGTTSIISVNVCSNLVNVIALLNPAFGPRCVSVNV